MSEQLHNNFNRIIRDRRLSKGWSTLFCARRLKIKKDQVEFLELGRTDKLPTGSRLVKILSDYLRLLGFANDEAAVIINNWEKTDRIDHHNFFGRKLISRQELWSFPQIVRNGLVALIIIVIAVYIGLSLKNIFSPPWLNIVNPVGDISTTQRQLWLSGQTDPEVQLDINGEAVLSDRLGGFSQLVNLRSGINYFNITATKKYGGQTTIIRQVMLTD
jgi:transcriptional regulator with XRE-family HTH domain